MIYLMMQLKFVRTAFLTGFIFCICFPCLGQSLLRDTLINVSPKQIYLLSTSYAPSIAIKCKSCDFTSSYLISRKDTIHVEMDPHSEQTAFVMVTNPAQSLYFYSGNIAEPIQFYFIKAGSISLQDQGQARTYSDACEINAILPEVWRKGLAAPTVKPTATPTKHIIIHHSATSNTINDPYLTVRSIYSYHTAVNGWDDIGYNYLIAPDGTIFQGRDDQGIVEPDYVLGAHLCGVNAGTMGICMLGTFSNSLPTQAALQSLYKLIKWKADKDEIRIFESSPHPIGPPSSPVTPGLLAHVGGHRDGCRTGYTECPGETLYQYLAVIREQVAAYQCSPSQASQVKVYPNPAQDKIKIDFAWEKLYIYDMQGKLRGSYRSQQEEFISLKGLPRGMYLFYFSTATHEQILQKVTVM